MRGTSILAIATLVLIVGGFIVSEVSRAAFERGLREGWHRGRAVNRQEFWSE